MNPIRRNVFILVCQGVNRWRDIAERARISRRRAIYELEALEAWGWAKRRMSDSGTFYEWTPEAGRE